MESTGGSSRGEVSIADALSQIEGNVKGRSEGFANLKHVLRHNQGNPKLGRLNDKYFHKVFEVLFRVASAERSAYLKSLDSTSKTVRSASATRLTSCASTLRLAVDVGLRKIRARTVAALLDHILDTLLDANGECCEPLALDYVRCLSALLSYEPHVEHLKKSQWEEVTAFCLARIQSANSQAAVNALVGTDRAASSSSRLSVRLSHTLSRSSQAAKTAGLLPKQVLDEFVTSLKHLTSAPFAPLLEKSKAILSAVLDSFRASSSMTQSQVNALVILNNTLQQVRTEDIGLTDTVTRDCIQVARQLWSSKLVSIKDEVLVLLVMLHPYIKKQSQTFEDPLFAGELESLVETLRTEYARRDVKDQLQLDDLALQLSPDHNNDHLSLQTWHVEKKETLALGRSSLVSKAWKDELDLAAKVKPNVELEDWIQILTLTICRWTEDDPVVGSLIDLITVIKESARQLFPFILHLALKVEIEKEQVIRTIMSGSFNSHFRDCKINVQSRQKSRLMLGALLHFLTQQFPSERTRMDRLNWLDIDYLLASQAAAWCGMSTTALYFAEIATTPVTSNRSTRRTKIDDPDSFYGVQQEASLQSVLDRVDHERDGLKGIMLHTARMDASMLRLGEVGESDSSGVIKSVGAMNLSSLTHDLLTKRRGQHLDNETMSTMLDAARKLGQWNISPPQTFETDTSMLYSIFRGLSAASDLKKFRMDLDHALKFSVRKLQDPQLDIISARSTLSALGVLTEVDEMISVTGSADLAALWETMQTRQSGWDIGRLHDAKQMMSYRESLFGILSRSTRLREALHVSLRDCRLIEVKAVISGSEFARKNDEIQQSLTAATYLSELLPICDDLGLKIDAAAHFEAASILWKQNEISSSVQILQGIRSRTDLETQAVKVGSAGLLAQLGHEVASARLEKPEDVISRYLRPAIAQLGKSSDRSETGRVYFEFASFCDQQLQSAGNIADFQRLAKISERRKAELRQYEEMLKDTRSSQKAQQRSTKLAAQRAQQWYKLDNEEYQRAKRSRDEFVQQALENYLNALKHCDDFNTCVVRFFSLWLEYSDSESANTAVSKPLVQVPSWKFIGLMNQLTSRLLKDGSLFQRFLTELVRRMCSEHPYHTVHDIFASCNSTISDTDTAAKMRKDAAVDIKLSLQDDKRVGNMCTRIFNAGVAYHKLAMTRVEAVTGKRYFLSTVRVAAEMDAKVRKLGVPPATLHLDLRPNANYKDVPTITRFRSEIKIANGLSAPKVLIAQGSDGKEYRQLFKGGNDDLRQDAIMEQVFEEVSKMLQKHKTTRQRNLHIRTYKVLPLSSTSGIIEFVPNSLPLADFLIPAHGKYHPSDLSNAKCREIIANASRLTKEQRYKEYKGVTEKFQPVLRHFFLERFEDPDEWFERRLAYSRSTAAISMLGYVLGLGDRHTHNILLDEKSGEVIHIDLGVAFEAGRVLPIPEVVPFRMTRDIVDGMGITKTEGVFRRCCEFTMDALREETDGIMTLLNVLRYDPLYSWTLSPIRAKRMQAAQEETESKAEGKAEGKLEAAKSNTGEDEGGEAERALSVVEKKLSKTLSTVATVNELIQQATDERNLAVLFAGWSAYA
ncbi:hypothetical protein MBLNU459_g3311t2 [Dothideomycetes sp. NU459]